jgi:hypothetical protein
MEDAQPDVMFGHSGGNDARHRARSIREQKPYCLLKGRMTEARRRGIRKASSRQPEIPQMRISPKGALTIYTKR